MVFGDPDYADGSDVPQLRYAEAEMEYVAATLGEDHTVVYGGARATEANLKAVGMADCKILHICAHSVVDHKRPEMSCVLLATIPDDDEDGRLLPADGAIP